VYKWSVNPITNPNPNEGHTHIHDNWCQKCLDWALHWILIIILPHYESGTNDGTDDGMTAV
jgi:hypothetical protein